MAVDFATVKLSFTPLTTKPVDLINHGQAYGFCRRGTGLLAGSSPNGLTTLNSAPTSATVTVRVRHPGRSVDGLIAATAASSGAGVWGVGTLNEQITFDVVGRLEDENDVIVAGVTPI